VAAGEGGGEQATGLGGDARRIVAEEILVAAHAERVNEFETPAGCIW